MPKEKHAEFAPSAAHRWLVCPGSILAERELPDHTTAYAEEGSLAHLVAGDALDRDLKEVVPGSVSLDGESVVVEPEMATHINAYLKYCRSLAPRAKAVSGEVRIGVEIKVKIPTVSKCWGTADFIAVDMKKRILHVVDFKYGKGVRVTAEKNPQLMIYGLGALFSFPLVSGEIFIKEVHLHIFQPRVDDGISEYTLKPKDLLDWYHLELKPAVRLAKSSLAPRFAGEHCRFCKAKTTCKTFAEYAQQELALRESDVQTRESSFVFPSPQDLNPEQISKVLTFVPLLQTWAKEVEVQGLAMAQGGMEIPGFELGEKRTNRRWAEGTEEQVVEILGKKKAYVRKLVSPAQAEKLVSKAKAAQLGNFVVRPPGAPVLHRKNKVKVEFAPPKNPVRPPKRKSLATPSKEETVELQESVNEKSGSVNPLDKFSDLL